MIELWICNLYEQISHTTGVLPGGKASVSMNFGESPIKAAMLISHRFEATVDSCKFAIKTIHFGQCFKSVVLCITLIQCRTTYSVVLGDENMENPWKYFVYLMAIPNENKHWSANFHRVGWFVLRHGWCIIRIYTRRKISTQLSPFPLTVTKICWQNFVFVAHCHPARTGVNTEVLVVFFFKVHVVFLGLEIK